MEVKVWKNSKKISDEKHHSLLQMYCLVNELSLIIDRLVVKEVDLMRKSNMEDAFIIYTLEDKKHINSRKNLL